jgi:hypothetical protein
VYVPQFCREFAVMAESIGCLERFAALLADTMAQFNCRLESFTPGTQSFAFIRDRIVALQHLLNEVGSAKIHATVFALLSQFIQLLSSFLSALTAASGTAGS